MRNAVRILVLAALASALPGMASADGERRRYCSESMVRGTYGIQLQGTSVAPNGQQQQVIGVVVRFYDGHGNLTQWGNIKESVTGYTPNRYGTGNYRVNDDCTMDVFLQPVPGVLLQERVVIMDDGNELRTISVLPETTMVTAVHRRI